MRITRCSHAPACRAAATQEVQVFDAQGNLYRVWLRCDRHVPPANPRTRVTPIEEEQ